MSIQTNNSPIKWNGTFTDAPFVCSAVNDSISVIITSPSVDVFPLSNDVATYGIDKSTFVITNQGGATIPAFFNITTGKLTFYVNVSDGVGVKIVKYKWLDAIGNPSNEGKIIVTVNPRPLGWRAVASSAFCVQSGGDNTGDLGYATLEKIYTDDNSLYSPYTTKSNTFGDPDYIAPHSDTSACPLPSSSSIITFTNNVLSSDINYQIIAGAIKTPGTSTIIQSFFLNCLRGQTKVVNVPPGTYDIHFAITGSNGNSHTATLSTDSSSQTVNANSDYYFGNKTLVTLVNNTINIS